jgi:hypothetical protein
LILLRHFEELMSVEAAEEFLIGLVLEKHKVRNSIAVRWIVAQHCRLIDDAIREAVETSWAEDGLHHVLRNAMVDYYERATSNNPFFLNSYLLNNLHRRAGRGTQAPRLLRRLSTRYRDNLTGIIIPVGESL